MHREQTKTRANVTRPAVCMFRELNDDRDAASISVMIVPQLLKIIYRRVTMPQISFFDVLFKDEQTIQVSAYRAGDHFVATIAGGWWIDHGSTMDAAVKGVVARYEYEVNHG